MKKKKIICVILLSAAIIWLLLDGIFYLNYGNTRSSTIHARNSDATVVQFELTDHIQELNIPKDSDAVIKGEIVNSGQTLHYLRVCQNDYLKEDLLLADGSYSPENLFYFAARISGGAVTEAWYSSKPLSEQDLRPLTFEEQTEQFRFVTLLTNPGLFLQSKGWYASGDLIGYSNKVIEGNMAKSRE